MTENKTINVSAEDNAEQTYFHQNRMASLIINMGSDGWEYENKTLTADGSYDFHFTRSKKTINVSAINYQNDSYMNNFCIVNGNEGWTWNDQKKLADGSVNIRLVKKIKPIDESPTQSPFLYALTRPRRM